MHILTQLPWRQGDQETRSKFEEHWRLLRRIVLYCMRFVEGQHVEAKLTQFQKDLMAYGRLSFEVCIRNWQCASLDVHME